MKMHMHISNVSCGSGEIVSGATGGEYARTRGTVTPPRGISINQDYHDPHLDNMLHMNYKDWRSLCELYLIGLLWLLPGLQPTSNAGV